ncbi:MAG: RES family NAD+ phosphorylase [Deltaproteobacteria bacterium]|nr:RES family NAD+ phosphorylase [Deltaproteobacteria bacterium]
MFDDSRACHRCFHNKDLIDYIRQEGKRGWCDWCGGRNVYVVPLYRLGDIFRAAVSIYKHDDNYSDSISFLLQGDWEVFSDKIEEAPDDLMQEMTVAILKAGLTEKDYFTDYPNYDEGFRSEDPWLADHWHGKAEAYFDRGRVQNGLKKFAENNNDPDYADLPDQLEAAFEDLSTLYEPGKILYRARIHKDRSRRDRFELSELSAPSPKEADVGRANRKGEPVFYLASDAKTALSEVRAWKGTAVALAKIKVRKRISVVSLLNYHAPESPFFNELIKWEVQLARLFSRLAYELSMPVMPHEEKNLYFSTQYLCDWVRKSGYDGIEYPSAMGNGFNVVLFNPEDAEGISLEYVRVEGIYHSTSTLKDNDPIYEEGPFDYLFQRIKQEKVQP